MCDERQLADWAARGLSRRGFGAGALAGAAAACAPKASEKTEGTSPEIISETVSFPTSAGTLDGEFFRPSEGKHPAVLFWPDIAGIRPAKRQMATRLAKEGYAVLLANPYYRDVAGQQFADFADFAGNGGFQKVTPWREKFSIDTIQTDASAAADWLLAQKGVDAARGMGTQGYCMTGSFAIVGAAAVPQMKAAASFHGGGLVRDEDPSPHEMLKPDVRYLILIAQNDDAKQPQAKVALQDFAQSIGCEAEIKVYPADHGWCVPDSPSYDEEQAERAWKRLLDLYGTAL